MQSHVQSSSVGIAASHSGRVSIRDFLRSETQAIHGAIHQAAPFVRLMRGELDLAGYRLLLKCLDAYHQSMAALVANGAKSLRLPLLADHHARRCSRLQADLHFLDEPAGSPNPLRTSSSPAFAIGCAYTVQGSMLGARVIDRALQTLAPETDGRSFFHGEEGEAQLWRDFCAKLEARSFTSDELLALAAGADFAFRYFESGLSRCR